MIATRQLSALELGERIATSRSIGDLRQVIGDIDNAVTGKGRLVLDLGTALQLKCRALDTIEGMVRGGASPAATPMERPHMGMADSALAERMAELRQVIIRPPVAEDGTPTPVHQIQTWRTEFASLVAEQSTREEAQANGTGGDGRQI